MKMIALTGHTRGLGAIIYKVLQRKGHSVKGFSLSSGCDLRDYSQVGSMIDATKNCNWFINCAHPDYCQTQILYRLMASEFPGKILNIGSPVVHRDPGWTDLGLMEYVTQKHALYHAHVSLSQHFFHRLFLWEPVHAANETYVTEYLTEIGL